MKSNISRLVITTKKKAEWIKFIFPDKKEMRILVRDHKSGNNKLSNLVIEAERDIKIEREDNDNIGNTKGY